jgi:hypothetical protein
LKHVLAAAALMAAGGLVRPASAQVQVRGRAITSVRYIELRPITYDSLQQRFVADERTHAAPLVQDLELSAWGLGLAGLRAYTLLRTRASLGDDAMWPRADDHFDALWAFVELDRPLYRLRLGRQQRASGLGFHAFDGATGTWRPRPTVRVEGYAGRALARGFLEPTGSPAIRALDPLVPDKGSLVFGGSVWAAPSRASSFTALYQVVELDDFSGVVSERASIDAQLGVGRWLLVRGSADRDIASNVWGRARFGVQWHRPRSLGLEAAVFRYRPTFDLTTIWGVFAPHSNSGFEAQVRAWPDRRIGLGAGYLYRRYTPTTAITPFDIGVDDETHQLSLNGSFSAGDFRLDGTYRLSGGYGGWRSAGEAELAWDKGGYWYAGFHGVAFQQYQEFRVAEGTVLGAGASLRASPVRWASLRGSVTRYWHTGTTGQSTPDWSQLRADLGMEITFGASADRAGGTR